MRRRPFMFLVATTCFVGWSGTVAATSRRWPLLTAAATRIHVPVPAGWRIERELGPATLIPLCDRQEVRLNGLGISARDDLADAIADDFRRHDHLDVAGLRCSALEVALLAMSGSFAVAAG